MYSNREALKKKSGLNPESVFLNLPVWANFYDLTDLSTYQYQYDFRQTSYFGLTQPKPQPQPG